MPSSLREAGQLAGEPPSGGDGVPERHEPELEPPGEAEQRPPKAPANSNCVSLMNQLHLITLPGRPGSIK